MSYGGRTSLGSKAHVPRPNQQRQTFSYPRLKTPEILQCMHELQVPLTEEELTTANKDALRRVYEAFIELCMGISKEELQQPVFSGLDALNYPQLHEDSIPEMNFFRALSKMMNVCGVHDFSLKDFISPDPARLRRHLSGLINFAKFREERIAMYEKLSATTENLMDQKQRAEDEQAELKRQVEALRAEKLAEEPALKQLTSDCGELEDEINELNKRQAVLRHETAELKTNNNELRDAIATKQYEILTDQEKVRTLKGQVVSSPAKFKREIEDIKEDLENEKGELADTERRSRDLQSYLDAIGRADKDAQKGIKFLLELEEEMMRCKTAKRDLKTKKQQIRESNAAAEEAEAQKQRLNRLLKQKQENLTSLRKTADLKSEASDQAMDAARSELEAAEADRMQALALVDESQQALALLRNKIAEEEGEHQEEMRDMIRVFKTMESAVSGYHEALLARLQASAA